MPAAWVIQAQRLRRWYRERVLELFETVDIIIAPATPCSATVIGQETIVLGGETMPLRPSLGMYTQPISFIGLPVVAAPIAGAGKLPIGIQIIGGPWRELDCLHVAKLLEQCGVAAAPVPQFVEGMIAGRVDGSANGTASAALAIGELASPGLLKIFCSNPSNTKFVLDEFIVAKDSSIKAIKELSGKRVASGPGIQNVTLAKTVLERAGATGATMDLTADFYLETGVIAKYILGDPMAPWFGGSASLSTAALQRDPAAVKKYIAAYARGVELVRKSPAEARHFLKGYTAIEEDLVNEVPLAGYTMYNEFTKSDVAMFQKFFDLFSDKKIFTARVMVDPLLYKG